MAESYPRYYSTHNILDNNGNNSLKSISLCFVNKISNFLMTLNAMTLSNIQYSSPIDMTFNANLTNYGLNARYFYA